MYDTCNLGGVWLTAILFLKPGFYTKPGFGIKVLGLFNPDSNIQVKGSS